MSKTYQHVFGLALALVLLAVSAGFFLTPQRSAPFVFAADNDDTVVDFEDAPLFNQDKLLPGDELVGRWFKVTNHSTDTDYPLYFVARKTGGDNRTPVDLASVLQIEIKKEAGDIIYNDTLAALFDRVDSDGDLDEDDGLSLQTTLGPGDSQKFFISVKFDQNATNDYQNKKVIWETILGFVGTTTEEGVLGAATGGEVLGVVTGANLIYPVLAALTMLLLGLYLHRRTAAA